MVKISTAILVAVAIAVPALAEIIDAPKELVPEKYELERIKANAVDQLSRSVMSSLYEINHRMKSVSKRRDTLNNKMMVAETSVKTLAKHAADLDQRLAEQRHQLSKRLRAMYMLGDEGVVRILFSSSNAQDLDQSLKYLKLISKNDIALISNYKKNLIELNRRRERLNREVKSLMTIKESMKTQEVQLENDQNSKAALLRTLANAKRKSIEKMAVLRGRAEDQQVLDLINLSFFEQKGRLVAPVKALNSTEFGLTQNDDYHYRLSHKGVDYMFAGEQNVQSVFKGRVAFAGPVDGYGQTLVLDHGDHYYTVYTHLNNLTVTIGQRIDSGTKIASAKDNMYFELRHFSDAIDPKPWLKE